MNEENNNIDISNDDSIVSDDIIAQQPLMAALMQQPETVPETMPETVPETVPDTTPLTGIVPEISTNDSLEQHNELASNNNIKNSNVTHEKKPIWPIILLVLAIVGYYGYKFYNSREKNGIFENTTNVNIKKISSCNEVEEFYEKNYNIGFGILGNNSTVDYTLLGSKNSSFDLKIDCNGEDKIKGVHIIDYKNDNDKLLEYYKPYATSIDDYDYFYNWLSYVEENGSLKLYETFSDTFEVKKSSKGTQLDIEVLHTNSKVALKDFGIHYENKKIVFSNGNFNTNIKMLSSINGERLDSTLVAQEGKNAAISFMYGKYALGYRIKQFDLSTIKELADQENLISVKIGDKECYYFNLEGMYVGFVPYESTNFGDDNQFGAEITFSESGYLVDYQMWMEVFESIVQ